MISTVMWWPSLSLVRDVEKEKSLELISLCGGRIGRKINNLHIFKNTSLGINCTDKFLPMFKGKKTTGFCTGFWRL